MLMKNAILVDSSSVQLSVSDLSQSASGCSNLGGSKEPITSSSAPSEEALHT